jgi:hypothetical protein
MATETKKVVKKSPRADLGVSHDTLVVAKRVNHWSSVFAALYGSAHLLIKRKVIFQTNGCCEGTQQRNKHSKYTQAPFMNNCSPSLVHHK